MNKQAPEKASRRKDALLDVHSIFHTIQGEGPFAGQPAVFIRLAGCNLQCPMCDTAYTEGRRLLPLDEIVQEVAVSHGIAPRGLVVITGGEPFRQNLTGLFAALTEEGYYVQVETNGTLEPSGWEYEWDVTVKLGVYIVCSPKAAKVHPSVANSAVAYKYVLSHDQVDPEDGLPLQALHHPVHHRVARPQRETQVFVQPMDWSGMADAVDVESMNRVSMQATIKSCMMYDYTFCLQVHKIIGVA